MHHNQYEEPLEMATGRGNTECGLILVYFKHQACQISLKKKEGTMQDSGSERSAITTSVLFGSEARIKYANLKQQLNFLQGFFTNNGSSLLLNE